MRKKTAKASTQALEELHAAIARELARKIENGEATAADLAVAAKFVKDNGVSVLIDPETPEGSTLTGTKLPDIGNTEEEFEEALRTFQ
ncbi:terminase small subunit protein [Rhizobium phage RHph_I20]|uniref:Terminase small subunit protein n=1 Tax=Rhizobium phage RHph_I20 TaxID=2509730 RepID=A0A7S5RBM3_9CAUD|nr:terminase small subunit protein [Rhizobium phage RHph_I20]